MLLELRRIIIALTIRMLSSKFMGLEVSLLRVSGMRGGNSEFLLGIASLREEL